MNEFYVVVDAATGAIRWRASGPPGDAARQKLDEGLVAIVVPEKSLLSDPINMDMIRAHYLVAIDAGAEQVRSLFITPGSGQAITYLRKETEARAYLADNSAETPMLAAEANAVNVSVAELASEVVANSEAWLAIGSRIEAARRAAKVAVAATNNLVVIRDLANIDWQVALTA